MPLYSVDRIVDELNPVQKLERQDITKLLIYSDDDPPSLQYDQCVDGIKDETLINTCKVWLFFLNIVLPLNN